MSLSLQSNEKVHDERYLAKCTVVAWDFCETGPENAPRVMIPARIDKTLYCRDRPWDCKITGILPYRATSSLVSMFLLIRFSVLLVN